MSFSLKVEMFMHSVLRPSAPKIFTQFQNVASILYEAHGDSTSDWRDDKSMPTVR